MKTILTLCILGFISCKTAFVSDYSFQRQVQPDHCYYSIRLNEPSFQVLIPITNTYAESVMEGDQWVSVENEEVVGYMARNESLDGFLYFMEEALNKHRGRGICGHIDVTRIHHQRNKDYRPGYSALTLFIPNILGMPLKLSKVSITYLFEVYDQDDHLLYRGNHSGKGRASLGFYYGYTNPEEKADYDATYYAVEDFMDHFNKD